MTKILPRRPQIWCALVLAACVLAAWPVAETGMHDDWSYVRTAQVFAQTGHVVYNGWGAPILGLQLIPAALFFKLFGFSFTVARLTTVFLSLITVALLQCTLVRCGLNAWNASIASLTVMLSPVCLPVVTSFLSDIPSMLAIVICLHCCLRALRATKDTEAIRWIWLAIAGNFLVGTSRQIAWLALLVMVPSTLFLVRRRRRVLIYGSVALAIGAGLVILAMHWFAAHPYTLPESFRPRGFHNVLHEPSIILRPLLEIPMLSLPVLLMFVIFWKKSSPKVNVLVAVVFGVFGVWIWWQVEQHTLLRFSAPIMTHFGDIWSAKGVYDSWPIWGNRPDFLPFWLRAVVSVLTFTGMLGLLTVTLYSTRSDDLTQRSGVTDNYELTVLLVPFVCAYVFLLLPRAMRGITIDRYLLPLVLVALIFLTLQYQEKVAPKLPWASVVFLSLMAFYSVSSLQDAFGAFRAVQRAADEIMASGVPRAHIDGGWEFDGLSQVDVGGYVHQSGIRMPAGQQLMFGHRRRGPCEIGIDVWIPNVEPEYALSYEANGCGGATSFPPVSYRRWYTGRLITLYVVKDPDMTGLHGLFPRF